MPTTAAASLQRQSPLTRPREARKVHMNHPQRVVLDEDDIRRTLVRIAHEIVEKHADRPVALVGIHRRGAHLATRLHQLVEDLLDTDVPLGDIDIAFYRDDLSMRAADP